MQSIFSEYKFPTRRQIEKEFNFIKIVLTSIFLQCMITLNFKSNKLTTVIINFIKFPLFQMFPYFTQQSSPFLQQQVYGNQIWFVPQPQYYVQPPINTIPQYSQNYYMTYNIESDSQKPIISALETMAPSPIEASNKKNFSCNCINTDCRKEYCICFKNGQICGQKCGCTNCRNKKIRQTGMILQKKKNVTCNCKKSECSKKYCECYASGNKCGENCHCEGCKNC